MTKSKILSEKNSFLNTNLLDALRLLDPTNKSKYIELLYNLYIKHYFDRYINNEDNSQEIEQILTERFGIDKKRIELLTMGERQHITMMLNSYINYDDFKIFKDFADLNERKLINIDITTIKNLTELSNHLTLAEFKKEIKDSEKNIKVLLRDEKWLILRPLSYASSLKYGKGTKWCTTHHDSYNFYRYSKRGVLIYIINLQTGNKTGFFHNFDKNDHETSFWNVMDQRVDSFETDLDSVAIETLKKEIKENKVTNFDLFPESEKNKYKSENLKGLRPIEMEVTELPQPMDEVDLGELQQEILRYNYPINDYPNLTGNVTVTNGATVVSMSDWVSNTTTDVRLD